MYLWQVPAANHIDTNIYVVYVCVCFVCFFLISIINREHDNANNLFIHSSAWIFFEKISAICIKNAIHTHIISSINELQIHVVYLIINIPLELQGKAS